MYISLKTLKVSHIQFGFDSGDIEILKNAGKRNTPEENLRATRLAIENGFNVIASYILMWPGETKEQLLNTYRNARKIYSLSKKEPDNIIFKTGFLRVYPGSDHFEMVCKINPAYRDMDNISDYMITQSFIESFYKNEEEFSDTLKYAKKISKRINQFNENKI